MINPSQYSDLILEPTYKALEMYSLDAMYLMLRTAMTESMLTHLKQLPSGPALGFMQIEPQTIADIYSYLNRREDIRRNLLSYLQLEYLPKNIMPFIYNLSLNAAFARIKYWMIEESIPAYTNVDGQAHYWKKYYNTDKGSGTVEMFEKISLSLNGCINHYIKKPEAEFVPLAT